MADFRHFRPPHRVRSCSLVFVGVRSGASRFVLAAAALVFCRSALIQNRGIWRLADFGLVMPDKWERLG